jgi:hypothetical protein
MLAERSLPFCFIIAKDGKRFVNEFTSYVDAGHRQYDPISLGSFVRQYEAIC